MSDLISKKWVTSAIMGLDYPTSKQQLIDIITNAPAIEQGEAVGYVVNKPWPQGIVPADPSGRWYQLRAEGEMVDDGTILYATPQQPQEQDELVRKAVADTLKEAAKYLEGKASRTDTGLICGRDAANDIRALIKRNAEEGE